MKQKAPATMDEKLLEKYVLGHMVAAQSGAQLFAETKKVWAGTDIGRRLKNLAAEVESDRVELNNIASRLKIRMHLSTKVLSRAGRTLSRLNPLNPTGSRDGLPGQLELEALHAAVAGKECLWHTLAELSTRDPRISGSRIQNLLGRAQDQQSRIAEIVRETAAIRFRTDRSFTAQPPPRQITP
ncbi:hypothetical protein [Arthrobacter roseus]|uniref:hypothetical protein n=1 Tax=Arthrobacter roseus TaxID=136274 RepID=UPI0019631A2F|nr:hypothetical protein [Arthrobacter roseus]MBM7848934.1 hypothetical protein [Arthrobacter roseus]